MIKCIKYAVSGSFTNARRKGNWLVGESTVGYGPTETTGFFNSIVSIDGSYSLYLPKESQGPSIFSFSDGDGLLDFCNQHLGSDQTTIFGVLDWINGQNDYFVDPNYFEFNHSMTSEQVYTLNLTAGTDLNFTVDWGDGTSNVITSYNQAEVSHTYPASSTPVDPPVDLLFQYWFGSEPTVYSSFAVPIRFGYGISYTVQTGQILYFLDGSSGTTYELQVISVNSSNGPYEANVNVLWINGSGSVRLPRGSRVESVLAGSPPPTEPYNVKIAGKLSNFKYNNSTALKEIKSWGCLNLTLPSAFQSDSSLICSAVDSPLITTGDTSRYFQSCSTFNGAIGNWDTSSVTNMTSMFGSAPAFNQNIGAWSTGAVTNMSFMFGNATAFNGSIGGWNTGAVTDMNQMFYNATAFNQNIGSWNTWAVTNMNQMFYNVTAFNQNIGGWNTGAVTNMSSMFENAIAFNQNIGTWNTGAVTNMSNMFRDATTFNQNISGWNTGAVTTMFRMFFDATAFNGSIGGWNTGAVTNMSQMFVTATAFNQNIGSWNTGAVTNMSQMFSTATAFNQNIGGWNTGAVTDMNQMFFAASSFNQNIGDWNVSNVTNFFNFMSDKTPGTFSATNLDAIYNGWSSRAVQPNRTISFGTAKYTSAGLAGRNALTGSPNFWTIVDGGQV
jgi:surface protein